VYTAGSWPAAATPSITALHLRYRTSDITSASATGNFPSSTGGGSRLSSNGNGGLSTGTKAAIGTIIPLVFIVGALAFFLLWRRTRQKKAAMALATKNLAYEKNTPPPGSLNLAPNHGYTVDAKSSSGAGAEAGAAAAAAAVAPRSDLQETPEWNVEMDATEAERQRLVPDPMSATTDTTDASELGGIARVARKPIPPVEIDGTPVAAEMGDAYIPYRPGVHGR
jgi:hypothetical protein